MALKNIAVTDSDAGVTPAPVTVVYNTKTYNVGDTNHNYALETTETWIFEATGTAVEGAYANTGTATGTTPTLPGTSVPTRQPTPRTTSASSRRSRSKDHQR